MNKQIPLRYRQIQAQLDQLSDQIQSMDAASMRSIWNICNLVISLRQFEKTYANWDDSYINGMIEKVVFRAKLFLYKYVNWCNSNPQQFENQNVALGLLRLQNLMIAEGIGLALSEEVNEMLVMAKLRKE